MLVLNCQYISISLIASFLLLLSPSLLAEDLDYSLEDLLELEGRKLVGGIPEYKLSKLPKHELFNAIDKGKKSRILSENAYFAGLAYRPMFLAYWAIEF